MFLKKVVNSPWFAVSSFVISLVGLIVSIVQNNIVLQIILSVFFVSYLIVVSTVIINRFLNINKIQSKLEKQYLQRLDSDIAFVSQLIKDEISSVSVLRKSSKDEDNFFSSIMKNNCEIIQKAIREVFSLKFDVCVKSMCVDTVVDSDVSTWKTLTIARASENYTKRIKHDDDRQAISNNTSFLSIIAKNNDSWAAYNIKEIINSLKEIGEEYKNPDKDYENYYKSTIVVPIRKKAKDFSNQEIKDLKIDESCSYHYLGFLCIDSMQIFDKNDETFKRLINFIIPIGEFLYNLYFEKLLNEIRTNQLAS